MKGKINIKKKLIIIIVIGVVITMGILGINLFTSFKEIDDEKSVSLDDINEIQVYLVREKVNVFQTDTGNEVQFHYYGKSKQELRLLTKIDNKSLRVEGKCDNNPLPRNCDPTPEDMCLDIYIPKEYGKNLVIRNTTGIIKISTIKLESLLIDTTTGGLEADQLSVDTISVKTTVGNITVKESDINELVINGTVSVVNINEGTVKVAKIKTTSGNISFNNCNGQNFNMIANSGNVHIVGKELKEQSIIVKTTSGNVKLELPGLAEFLLKAKSNSGKIITDFITNTTDEKKLGVHIGAEKNEVNLQSTSGSIEIMKK